MTLLNRSNTTQPNIDPQTNRIRQFMSDKEQLFIYQVVA